MEVKIKECYGYVDAEWTIENGVMVVSPKGVFKPKNGDVIVCSNVLGYWTLIFRKIEPYNVVRHHAVLVDNGTLKINDQSSYTNPRYATEEEKKLLFDKLAEEGYSWDSENKELVKLKWKPSVGQHFYFVEYDNEDFIFIVKAYTYAFKHQIESDKTIAKGWCFKTSKECQEFCDKLNQAINQVKP